MTILTNTKLETIDYSQPNWDKIINSNSGKMESIFSSFSNIWDSSSKSDGYGIKWNGTSWIVSEVITVQSPVALTDAETISIDGSLSKSFAVTLEGNRTFGAPTNLVDGAIYYFQITQDSVGSRTLSFNSIFKFNTTPVLSTDAGAVDIVKGVCVGSDLYCELFKNFKAVSTSKSYTAKSVILDIADNWGGTPYIVFRAMDFYNPDDNKILLTNSDFVAYATSTTEFYYPKNIFISNLSKIGPVNITPSSSNSYVSASGDTTNIRVIIVFNTAQDISKIIITNAHNSGAATDKGVKNAKIHISTDAITNTTYNAAISNSTKIFDGQFDQHVASDVEDPQTLELI